MWRGTQRKYATSLPLPALQRAVRTAQRTERPRVLHTVTCILSSQQTNRGRLRRSELTRTILLCEGCHRRTTRRVHAGRRNSCASTDIFRHLVHCDHSILRVYVAIQSQICQTPRSSFDIARGCPVVRNSQSLAQAGLLEVGMGLSTVLKVP